MRIRYKGADEARDLAVAGGLIVCPQGKWVDVAKEAAATGIAPGHAEIVARELADQPDWELEPTGKKKPDNTEASEPPANEEHS